MILKGYILDKEGRGECSRTAYVSFVYKVSDYLQGIFYIRYNVSSSRSPT
jgi:hypothetical protein